MPPFLPWCFLRLASAARSRAPPARDSAEKPAATPARALASPTAKPAANGSHEGIAVRGHWTIEVKNPDGSLVRQVEFENSLDPGFNLPYSATAAIRVPGGAALLGNMLNGTANPSPGAWGIILVGPAGLANLSTTANAPCIVRLSAPPVLATVQLDACVLFPPTTSNSPPIVGSNPCPLTPRCLRGSAATSVLLLLLLL